uniref:Piezo type mechanosensitive ion channel component 1 (Er blood group) n=1 Tax=Gasterosteus aculeatus aculeatus TaxID=481459 RepID=G3NCT7_GASAC
RRAVSRYPCQKLHPSPSLSFFSLCLPGHTGRFIRVVFCTSLLFVLAHICFQTLLYTYPPLSIAIGDNCSQWDTIRDQFNMICHHREETVLRLLVPDLGVCVVALTTLVLCSRLVRNRETVAAANITSHEEDEEKEASEDEDGEESSLAGDPDEDVSTATRAKQLAERLKTKARKVLRDLWKMLAIGLLALAGITLPSAFSAIYFLLFIGVCTWWACHLPISHLGFNALCVMVGFFTAGHMVCLYVYQSLLVQALFPPRSLWARLFGLKDIIIPGNCSSPYDLNLNADHDWPVYVNPGILFLLYITIVTVLKTGCRETPNQVSATSSSSVTPIDFDRSAGPPSAPSGPPSAPSGPPSGPQQSESPFFLLGKVVMQQSYVCALIAMMVWSITYHSWLTFVLLLWIPKCIPCVGQSKRHAATLCSPFILLYGLALCCLQYVWAMELRPELPTTVGTMSLRQLGLDRAQHPCLRLGAMLLFTLTFWLLVRQSVKENFSRKRKMNTPLQEVTTGGGAGEESVLKVLGGMVMGCWAKYWIYVCGGMFIMVSFAGKLVGYKIVYMLLFLICLCLYQVYYSLWRRLLKLFWWLVVAYTMLVLISIYTFQFEDFPGYWRNFTGFTEEQLAAVGLETFALSELFSSILIPGFFLLACILQLHYFHKPFMRITDLEHVTPIHNREEGARGAGGDEESEDEAELLPSKWGLVMDRLLVLSSRFSDILTKVQVFLWRLLELHILKMVAFFSVWVSLQEPSVMNLVLVVLWSLAMPYSRFGHMASCLSTVWVCVIIVCKMLYQLSVVNPAEYSSNCSLPLTNETNLLPEEMMNSSLYEEPVDPAKWFGIRKDATALGYSKNHLIVLMLLVFEATVYRHQSHHYRQLQRSPPTIPALFPAATRDTLDQGLISCFKYLLNYTFYKFGLEICFLMTVNVIGQRMNFLVIIHGCWLVAILVRRRRAAIARIWPRYCLFLSIFMMYQYLLCVGIPPALCIDYPWRWNTPVLINSALVKWIFLPDFYTVPNSKNLIADFVLLMCASQQWKVFECEQTEDWMVLAGENTDDPEPMKGQPFNPAPNFINCRSYLDMAKVLVFRHLFWFVLSVVFITGATRISVFGLGYLLACFFFLLFGTRLLVKSSRTRLALWDCLIMYNVAVIVSKNMLSILACVFVFEMQKGFCWVIQLFSLVCTVKGYYDPKAVSDNTCSLPVEEAGIIWDSICFLCLLLQRRVFLSFYFLHVIAEMQASAQQASRGFELFRASIVKNIKFHQQAERKSLSQLKRSMQRIRAKQQKYRDGHKTSEDSNESHNRHQKSSRKENWSRPWLDHATVLHSGEYYLFESDSEDEEDTDEQKPQKQTACELAYLAWVTSVKTALKERQRHQRHLKSIERKEKEKEKQGRVDLQQEVFSAAGHGEMVQRILDILRFLWAIVLAMVDGLTQWLNLLTRQYRETSTVLCNERYFVHDTTGDFTEDQVSQGSESTTLETCLDETDETDSRHRLVTLKHGHACAVFVHYRLKCTEHLMELVPPPSKQQHRQSRTASELLGERQFFIKELEQSREFYKNQNRLLKLLFALHDLLAANSELVCYFIIVVNNGVSASVISLVLPILVFLWAMLAVPRPTKRFWMTAIVYTEVMVVVKYLFQFGFFPWNSVYEMTLNEDKPFFPPRILGLEKTDNYIRYDLLQLLALFFHRSLLMRYGLWDHEGPLKEQSPSPESCKDEETKREADEEGRKKEGRGQEGEGRVSSTSTLDNLEITELDPFEKVDNEQVVQEVPKKSSSIRFRHKLKKTADPSGAEPVTKKQKGRRSEAASRRLQAAGHKLKQVFLSGVYRPTRGFFMGILHAEHRAATDVYALMFLTDVVDFVIIVFGFWAFGKHSAAADIASTLSEDQVPEAFLVMLLIQFSTMIIDRALYLRKAVLGKLIFQVILVFGIHFWMFFILPAVTERKFNQNFVAQLWYFVKCIYFGLSAYQIRCAYPTRILGNFLTKKYNHLNLFLFQGFRMVPFLVELRAVMDWVWTDTTLSLSDWMCVEDIYANIFIIKCSRETEKKYPQPKGQKKKKIVKYGMGGLIIVFLICIIWFPLLFISLVRSVVGVVNHPIDVTVTVKLGGYESLFTMSVQQQSIQPFTQVEYDQLTGKFGDNAVAMQFITLYSYEDIVTAMIEGSSGSVWRISPPSRQEVIKELLGSPVDLTLRLAWTFQRDLGKGGTVEHTFDKHSIDLEPGNPVRADLASLLVGNRTRPVLIPNMLPNYIRAPNGAEAKPVTQLYKGNEDGYLNITLSLKNDGSLNGSANQEWWDIAIAGCASSSCGVLPIVIFNDKVSPPSLGFLAGYGIMGLYVSVVLVIGKFVRGFFSEISHSIMFEELPCVDRILKLCTDIFLVRETGELELEEELYSKLIFLYRSPETMIKWTRDIDDINK